MSWASIGKALAGIVTGPAGLIATVGGELIADFVASRQNRRKLEEAAAEYRQQQARDTQRYTAEWELQALTNRGVWMQRGTLILFCWPLLWAHLDPDAVKAYFDTLEQMPPWYLAALATMLGAIWGSQKLRELRAGRPQP